MKWTFVLLFSLSISFSFASESRNQYLGVVLLVSKDKKPLGTGFFNSFNTLTTALHVLGRFQGPIKENIFFVDPIRNTLQPVTEILALDIDHDLVLLKTDYHSEVFYPVELSVDTGDDISPSDQMTVPGFPLDQFNLMRGRVGERYDAFICLHVTKTERRNHDFSGNSGSPVFSEEGKLAGVVLEAIQTSRTKSHTGLRFVSVEKLKDLIEKPKLSCVTNSCIEEEERKKMSQALAGDKNSQFFIGLKIKQQGDFYSEQLLTPLQQWLSSSSNEEKTRTRRVSGLLSEQYKIALDWLEKAALQGHGGAQFCLGVMYDFGKGVERDFLKAAYWYGEAAKQGHGEAQFQIARMYLKGLGVEKNLKEALYWFREAAKQNHTRAQFQLGHLYSQMAESLSEEALYWFRKAAKQGQREAQFQIAGMYLKGLGVEKNLKEAVYWFREAALQGHKEAQYQLGLLYAYGESRIRNLGEAIRWFREAAEQDDMVAQIQLGWMYDQGNEVEKHPKAAVYRYEEAAEQNHMESQYRVGWMYFYQIGVERNIEKAAYWLSKASQQGHVEAQVLIEVINEKFRELEEKMQKDFELKYLSRG